MSRTGYKQAFWDKQPIVKCPLCDCPWDEGQKLEEWFLKCVKEWLIEKRQQKFDESLTPEGFHTDYYHIKAALINELLEELKLCLN